MSKKKSFNPDNNSLKDKVIHKSGDAGGMLVGNRHINNGIQAINKSTNHPLEMEGGEVVITRNAVSDNKKRSFNGEMLTNREILSKINVSGGGVSFANGGDIPTSMSFNSVEEFEYGGKTMCGETIAYEMAKDDNSIFLSKGGSLKKGKKTDTSGFSKNITNWNEVPPSFKDTKKIKKVTWANNPFDKGLHKIVANHISNDNLREVLTSISFDKNGITTTNAHTLISLPYPNKKYNGVYDKDLYKQSEKQIEPKNIKYVSYENIIPEHNSAQSKGLISVYKLLQYTRVALKYTNETTNEVTFLINNEKVTFNGLLLINVLSSWLMLGKENIYFNYFSPNKGVVFSDELNYNLGVNEMFLIMPIRAVNNSLGSTDIDFNRSLRCYFDFNKNEIINEDGSVADFKMKYEDNSILNSQEVRFLKKTLNKNSTSLPILELFKVSNNTLTVTNLESTVTINNVPLRNGMYDFRYDVPEITMESLDDFPSTPVMGDTDFVFNIPKEVLSYYIDKLILSSGNDDLRPVLKGVLIHYRYDGRVFLVSTDAHILLKIEISSYIKVIKKPSEEFKTILSKSWLDSYIKVCDSENITVSCNKTNVSMTSKHADLLSRCIDGNYPNYQAVIPTYTTKNLSFSLSDIKKCLKTPKTKESLKNFKKAYNDVVLENKSEKWELKGYSGNPVSLEKEVDVCDSKVLVSEDSFSVPESILLVMAFRSFDSNNDSIKIPVKQFDRVFKIIPENNVVLHKEERDHSPYVISIDDFSYKTTTDDFKKKEQKKKPKVKVDLELGEKEDELLEAIKLLELLYSVSDNKEKKSIKEAIKLLNLLK